MHGVTDYASDYYNLGNFTKEAHPGTQVFILAINQGLDSLFRDIPSQVENFRNTVEALKREHGFTHHHLVCHSQGGIICRV